MCGPGWPGAHRDCPECRVVCLALERCWYVLYCSSYIFMFLRFLLRKKQHVFLILVLESFLFFPISFTESTPMFRKT